MNDNSLTVNGVRVEVFTSGDIVLDRLKGLSEGLYEEVRDYLSAGNRSAAYRDFSGDELTGVIAFVDVASCFSKGPVGVVGSCVYVATLTAKAVTSEVAEPSSALYESVFYKVLIHLLETVRAA